VTVVPERESLAGAEWQIRFDPDDRGELFAEELNRTHRADARWMSTPHGDGWSPVRIGATWNGQGHDRNGVAWYRCALPGGPPAGSPVRTFIEFESVDYFADVWINGRCLGSHESPATSFRYELTRYLHAERNLLAVRVDSPVSSPGFLEETGQLKTLFKGVLERADTNNPDLVPGGITGDVTLIRTGPGRLSSMHVDAAPAGSAPQAGPRADSLVTVTAFLDGPGGTRATVRARLLAPDQTVVHDDQLEVTLTGTRQPVMFQAALTDAELWWPWDLGTPALHEAVLDVEVEGRPSDVGRCRFGIRSVSRGAGWATYVNGVRVFQRGANYVCDQLRENATDERYRADVDLLVGANLNTVHPFCVVERQSFYDSCDEAGLLVYQDFPAWMTVDDGSGTMRRALALHRELIAQLGHHPSIITWNCGSQASVANTRKLCSALAAQAQELDPSRIANLTNAVVATAEDQHRTHPRRSFFWDISHARRLADDLDWRWDTHHYQGWYTGEVSDIDTEPAEHLELVTEFGAQGIPGRDALSAMLPDHSLWPPDWEAWAGRCAQPELLLRRLPEVSDLDALIQASQAYQATVVQHHAEHYRRLRFRPCNGAHVFMFADYWPAITWSVLDYGRQPKAAYAALARAMAPTQVLLKLPVAITSRAAITVPVTVVNDRLVRYRGAAISISLDRHELTSLRPLDIPGNDTITLDPIRLPKLPPGAHTVTTTLRDAEGRPIAVNAYALTAS
jgi:beta-mannosidase